jgi:hypothetical protein
MINFILKNSFRRRLLIVFVGLIVWAAITLPITLTFLEVGHDEFSKSSNSVIYQTDSKDYIEIGVRLQFIDLPKRTIKYYIDFFPVGKYDGKEFNKWNTDITVDFGHKVYNFKNGTKIEPVVFDIPLISGNIMDYPFDRYKAIISFIVEETKFSELIPINIGTSINTANSAMTFTRYKDYEDYNSDYIVFLIDIKRTPMVYAFCFFVSTASWTLAIALLNFSIDTTILGRELPVQLPAIGVSMLFTLPAFRRSMPEIPDIGCAIDFLYFIWCEIIVAVCTSINLYTWLNILKKTSNR